MLMLSESARYRRWQGSQLDGVKMMLDIMLGGYGQNRSYYICVPLDQHFAMVCSASGGGNTNNYFGGAL
jgi:hypothetical protein